MSHHQNASCFSSSNDSLSFSNYRKMAAKAPVLSQEEEIDLVKRAHKGDSVARNRFIIAQLPMLVYWADMSINWRVDKEDLIGFGVECVISALNSFNPNLENRFATYLGKNILYKMNDYHKVWLHLGIKNYN